MNEPDESAAWKRAYAAIDERRIELGLSWSTLHDVGKVSQRTLYKMRDDGVPLATRVKRSTLCRALGWSADSLDRIVAGEPPVQVGAAERGELAVLIDTFPEDEPRWIPRMAALLPHLDARSLGTALYHIEEVAGRGLSSEDRGALSVALTHVSPDILRSSGSSWVADRLIGRPPAIYRATSEDRISRLENGLADLKAIVESLQRSVETALGALVDEKRDAEQAQISKPADPAVDATQSPAP